MSKDNLDTTERLSVTEITDASARAAEIEEKRTRRSSHSSGHHHRHKKAVLGKGYIALGFAALLVCLLVVAVLFILTRYSLVSSSLFVKVNQAAMLALVTLILIVIVTLIAKKKAVLILAWVLLALFVGVGGYTAYALARVDTNVDLMTADSSEESVGTSLVTYSHASGTSPITSVEDLDGKKVGIALGTSSASLTKARLSNEGVEPEYVEYEGYTKLFIALINGDVDCAALPDGYQTMFLNEEDLAGYLDGVTEVLTFTDTVTTNSYANTGKDVTKEPFTVLLTGENEGLADTIILVSINPVSMKVTMTSIARDSYVPISCYNGGSDKINAAHVVSEGCMVETVEDLTGIDIDYTVEFNFASVIQVVDAVGGVDVDITEDFVGQSWNIEKDELEVFEIEKGDNVHLNGQLALAFARERYAFSDGDFARQRHQQQIITQIIQKIMATRDPNTILKVLDAAGQNIKTNMDEEQILSFIRFAMNKANRYYDSDNVAGIFNIVNWRVTGYESWIWNDSLGMELWIYRLYNGSVKDTADYIERNLNLYSKITSPEPVNWSAVDSYEQETISYDYYDEAIITDSGKPSTSESTDYNSSSTDYNYNNSSTDYNYNYNNSTTDYNNYNYNSDDNNNSSTDYNYSSDDYNSTNSGSETGGSTVTAEETGGAVVAQPDDDSGGAVVAQ